MKRVIILVIDSLGVGAMPDAASYGDSPDCNTLANVAKFNNGLKLPNLQKMGLGNITDVEGVLAVDQAVANWGKMHELSEGKDTTTGHWEMAGIVLDQPFNVYPQGFPEALMDLFVSKTGCKGYLANYPASGTDIIEKYNEEHRKTGFPIIYTSADSVFQVACNVDVIPLPTLYEWCETARQLLGDEYNTSRVIARPFEETNDGLKRIAAKRKDYSVKPMKTTLLNLVKSQQGRVIAVGKIEDIFVSSGVTHSIHTGSNAEGLEVILKAFSGNLTLDEYEVDKISDANVDKELVFINLVDTDMLYGHRNDAYGYGQALEEIDVTIGKILPLLTSEDLLLITADHGCDPTHKGTDHTREAVPVIAYSHEATGLNLGTQPSFTYIARSSAQWLGLSNIPSHW